MEIRYLGHSSFLLKGKHASVVTDPYSSEMTGLKFPKHVQADLVTVSHQHSDHNAVANLESDPFVIEQPGEYEIKGVSVLGYGVYHDESNGEERGSNTMYRIEIDGLSIMHLGDLGHILTPAQLEMIDGVDILFVPVGGFFTIGPAQAETIVKDIDPSIVIPMHYRRADMNQQQFGKLEELTTFLKEIAKEDVQPQPKLVVTHDSLPTELQVVVLE